MKKLKMHCRSWIITAAAAIFAAAAVPSVVYAKPNYIKAATYAGKDWVINFWNTELDHLEQDLEQIRDDGFNGIVLVVPWREFQPKLSPVSYNDAAFRRLDQIMDAADRHGLWVQLRVSYTWDYYDTSDVKVRFRKLLRDPDVQKAWKSYIQKIYKTAASHDHFYGGFITWEDFWNYMEDSVYYGSGADSVKEAKEVGYQEWLKDHYSLERLNDLYQPVREFRDYDMVHIPEESSPGRKAFYEFYDYKLNEILSEGQSVFPDLSMEVRLDKDPVEDGKGGKIGMSHAVTFPCKESDYTSLMYSVSMGESFQKELSASEALRMMRIQLSEVRSKNKGKPIFIDQLLYMDATEKYSYNARLAPEERTAYLVSLPEILQEYTNGYAVWTYRNYANNTVYNSQFGLGTQGWDLNRVHIKEHDGSSMASFEAGGRLTQSMKGRDTGDSDHEKHVRFTAQSDRGSAVNITVTLGTKRRTVTVKEMETIDLNMGKGDYDQIMIMSDGYAYVDNISVYNFVQDGQLYDLDGKELSCIRAIRQLNGQL